MTLQAELEQILQAFDRFCRIPEDNQPLQLSGDEALAAILATLQTAVLAAAPEKALLDPINQLESIDWLGKDPNPSSNYFLKYICYFGFVILN